MLGVLKRHPRRAAVIAGASALLIVILGAGFFGWSRGCTSRDEVASHVAVATSQFQEAASQGEITIEQLADGVRRLNAAATAYETDHDHGAYCKAVDTLREELMPKR